MLTWIIVIIIVGLFVFFLPGWGWLSLPIGLGILILKEVITKAVREEQNKPSGDSPKAEYDEFDWWQDNQGL